MSWPCSRPRLGGSALILLDLLDHSAWRQLPTSAADSGRYDTPWCPAHLKAAVVPRRPQLPELARSSYAAMCAEVCSAVVAEVPWGCSPPRCRSPSGRRARRPAAILRPGQLTGV